MQLVTAAQIARIMNLPDDGMTFSRLEHWVSEGLPKDALRQSAEHVCPPGTPATDIIYGIVPQASFKRRKETLTADESAKTERLARVFAMAEMVWDSPDEAREFLNHPHPLLEGRTPLAVSRTELGARRVEELLGRLYYGIPA